MRAGRPRDAAADRAITAAAFALLQEEGYRGLSIEAVAARAGVAKTTIYRRYPTKRELVVGAMIAETQIQPPPPGIDSREGIRGLVRQGVQMLVGAGAMRILATFLVEEEREPELMATFRARLVEPRRAMLLGLLRAGVERGEVRADADLDLVTEMMLGSVLAHQVRGGAPPDDAWIDALVATLWAAIRA